MKPYKALITTLIFSLAFTGCSKTTTLATIGNDIVIAANAYAITLDELRGSGTISPEKYAALKAQAVLAQSRAQEFKAQLAGLSEVSTKDIPALTQKIAGLTAFFQTLLSDSGLSANSTPIRTLTYIINSLNAAAVVINHIHPATTAGSVVGIEKKPKASEIKIVLPAPDRDVSAALRKAGR